MSKLNQALDLINDKALYIKLVKAYNDLGLYVPSLGSLLESIGKLREANNNDLEQIEQLVGDCKRGLGMAKTQIHTSLGGHEWHSETNRLLKGNIEFAQETLKIMRETISKVSEAISAQRNDLQPE